jgi:hypothetical protein
MTYTKLCIAWLIAYAVGIGLVLMDLLVWRPG